MKRMLLLGVPSALLLTTTALADNYYVDSVVSASGDGSLQSPFATMQECADIAIAGDTCVLREGTHLEGDIAVANDGQDGSPITFAAYPDERAVLDGDSQHERAFDVAGRDYITIRGLEFQHYLGRPIVFYASADHALIEHNIIHDIHERNGHLKGIQLQDTEGGVVQFNTIYDLFGYNEAFGIFTDGQQRDTVIRGNLLYLIDKSGIRVTCQAGSTSITVEGNIALHSPYAGIEINSCWPSGSVLVRNNFVGFNGAAGFHPKHTDHVTVEHNTVVQNGQFGLWSAGGTGVDANADHLLQDNIVFNNVEGTYLDQGTVDLSPVVDYQLYLNDGHTDVLLDIHGADRYSSLLDIQANTPFEAHGLVADPLFQAPAQGDFRLQPGSPAAGSAHDGTDRGADAAVLQGVGAALDRGLGNIPMLPELSLTVLAASSETAEGPAANAADPSRATLWIPETTGPEWIDLDLPGQEPTQISRLALLRANHLSSDNPAEFAVHIKADSTAAWSQIAVPDDPFEAYIGAAGRLWKLLPGTSAVAVRIELLGNHGGSRLELAGVRLYGVDQGGTGGAGGTGGGGGMAGAGGGGNVGGGSGGTGGTSTGPPIAPADDAGSCGCRLPARSPAPSAWWLAVLVPWGWRRRSERSPSHR